MNENTKQKKPRPLTVRTALKKARDLWGERACVKDHGQAVVNDRGVKLGGRYSVGRVMLGMFFEVKGDGDTWEAAFQKAADAEERDRARYAALRKERRR